MHELILLRHAEAMSSAPDGTDMARPLSPHGEEEARATGQWLREHGVTPALILVSTAQRAMMTARHVADMFEGCPLRHDPDIYEATPGDLLTLIDRHAADIDGAVLLVGHNPGLERLVALLVEGRSQSFRGMPPGAVAQIAIDGELEPGNGRLVAFWSPT